MMISILRRKRITFQYLYILDCRILENTTMQKVLLSGVMLLICMSLWPQVLNISLIRPGEIWPDTEGNHINAHGGGIIFHDGTYYWFGESRLPSTEQDRTMYGVGCYSSTDLLTWKNEIGRASCRERV